MNDLYVNIALNVPIDKLFTYKVPDYFVDEIEIGKRVLVSFGKKTLTGLILSTSNKTDLDYVKNVKAILDDERIISDELIRFCKWVAEYYIAPVGEVLFSAVPRNINIRSELYFSLTDDYRDKLDKSKLKDNLLIDVIKIFEQSRDELLTQKQIAKRLNSKQVTSLLKKLSDAEVLKKESFYTKPTKEKLVKIATPLFDPDELHRVIQENKITGKKQILFLEFIDGNKEAELSLVYEHIGITLASLRSLEKKGIIKIREERKIRQSADIFTEKKKQVTLNNEQKTALSRINETLDKNEFKPFLLYGVTGSGKTEVYLRAIEYALEQGKNAVVLVPEISLTPQLIHRFRMKFGDLIGVIHSRLSDGERLDTFDKIRNGGYRIVIGARSAIFAPLENIGIIIVDEEHDSSYKQENSPRYNGRDSAIVRAQINDAVVVMGSATPSIESYTNALNGKYELLTLPHRATNIKMPDIEIIDTSHRDKERTEEYLVTRSEKVKQDFLDFIDKVRVKFLSKDIIIALDDRLDKKESTILLQNRRGYHAYIECSSCGHVEMCPRCDIALTYHKAFERMLCHYCGFSRSMTTNCSECNSDRLIPMGAGTERVEEEIAKLFPSASVERMDSDTLTSRVKYQQILNDFYEKKIDILVGTQIISKGLDFPNVTLVGVVNADIGLLHPDFRATEKTFQILTQVSGRSGRSEKAGEVIIQTNHPDYFVFDNVRNHDYNAFYYNEIKARKAVNYPPYSRLALIEAKSEDRREVESKIKEMFNFIKTVDTEKILDVLPPHPPLFAKLKDKYRFHLLIKSSRQKDPGGKYLNKILRMAKGYAEENIPQKVQIIIDVDVMSLM
ncbi:MAG: primosomal protein N' [Ignavibacteriae bacterium]|nr:primosomal protein N' [Ignavibacteriota bacterium]MCB9243541.1 primosomal protein N' [Ignavibacteriales bacterium]